MFRKLVFPFGFFISFWGVSQGSAKYSLGTDLNYHPQDFFFHIRGQISKKNLVQDAFLGFGINKTIFLGQISPVAGYDLGYCFGLTNWFSLTPYLRFSYSFLDTKVPSAHPFIHTTESFLACRLAFGKQNKLALNAGIGPALEWKYDAYQERNNHFLIWNYFMGLTYYYEF
ncbi:hypothetical protein [Fluviicola sp.]|jgi:hypothetical protein|uniref:hypothetical protein n=1 Tax=Fluviicola sp. TaxID=1917219 RepID=UPI0028365E67|nr:hypothetical protein [Fluviicola sp.]MDR0803109.1 hypothetical protein [Fluviicola sp.]